MYYLPHQIGDNSFILSAGRTLFWENEKCLILSDMHLGKSGHFRKHGIGIPQNMLQEDLFRLSEQIRFFNPPYLIVVGDMFHSYDNKEHELFQKYRKEILPVDIHLVAGNHDILTERRYLEMGIQVHRSEIRMSNLIFSHELPEEGRNAEDYWITGHIHPGISLKGRGRQSLKLPCFYFGKGHAILPAYGRFTGTVSIEPDGEDEIFAIADQKLIRI
jgi:DNA ligase-associated metallophosphoesterase